MNPSCISLLEKNPDKINWINISANPGIFTYDYDKMREYRNPIAAELMANRFHIRNMHKWKRDWGFDDCIDLEELQ
jgi:hypothetical protein